MVCSLFRAIFLIVLCSLLISLFKMAPDCSSGIMSSVPKHVKGEMCLMERMQCEISFIQVHIIVPLAMNSMLMSQC